MAASVAFVTSGPQHMTSRYTITVTDRQGSKARYRTALKLLGAENIRIEETEATDQQKPKKDNIPTSPEAKAVATLFKRKHDTEWADEEITAFKKAVKANLMTIENITLVANHYRKNSGIEGSYLRTSLLTFCRHFGTELDKARAVKPVNCRLEWPKDDKVVPMPSQEEQDRIAAKAREEAEKFRKEMRS